MSWWVYYRKYGYWYECRAVLASGEEFSREVVTHLEDARSVLFDRKPETVTALAAKYGPLEFIGVFIDA